MISLNKKQKNLIKKTMKQDDNISCYEHLSYDVKMELEKLNDFETIHDCVTRYIHEQIMS